MSNFIKSAAKLASTLVSKYIFDYIRSAYPSCTPIFTDGSVFEDKVGVAVHIPSHEISIAYRSSNKLSSFSAELEAIFTAISLVIKHNIANPLILTDSLNIINQFQNVPSAFAGNLMHVCRDLITLNNTNLSMFWIPGHSNIRDHDIADLLAKRSLSVVAPRSLAQLGPQDLSD